VSIRSTLGASRWRIVRQLLVESSLHSIAAGMLGWLIALWGVRVFDGALVPAVKPPYTDFAMDARVFAYLAAITAGAAILCGIAPVLHLSRLDVSAALKEGSNAAGASRRTRALFGLLVVAEMSLAVVLLTGAYAWPLAHGQETSPAWYSDRAPCRWRWAWPSASPPRWR
jgi:putative ABC transport system permease protein